MLEARGDHAAHGAAAGGGPAGGRAAAGRRRDRPGRRGGRRRARARAGHRQGRLHGLDGRRQEHPGGARGARECRSRSSSAASPRTSCSRTPRDQAVEGIVNGIFFNQGHVCCAGSRLLIQESVADVVTAKLWERMGRLRVGDPLDKNTDVGAINSGEQLERIERSSMRGRTRARPPAVACELPERGWWFAPTMFTDVGPHTGSRWRRSSGRSSRPDLPHAGRGDREGQRLDPTASRPGSGPTRAPRPSRSPARCRPAGLAEHLQPLRPDRGVRRLQGKRLRARGRPRRAAALPRVR